MFAVSIIAVERKGWWFAPPTQTFLLPSGQLWYTPTAIKRLVGVPDRNMRRLHLHLFALIESVASLVAVRLLLALSKPNSSP